MRRGRVFREIDDELALQGACLDRTSTARWCFPPWTLELDMKADRSQFELLSFRLHS